MALVLLSSWACNDQPSCLPEQSDIVKLSFVDADGKTQNLTYTKLVVKDAPADFPVPQDTSLSALNIPLNPNATEIDLTFYLATGTNHLALTYRATPVVLHPKCSLELRYDYLAVKESDFSKATIIDAVISTETSTNVQITL